MIKGLFANNFADLFLYLSGLFVLLGVFLSESSIHSMIKKIVNASLSRYLQWRYVRLQRAVRQVSYTQNTLLKKLLQTAQSTEFGRKYQFRKLRDHHAYAERVPIFEYEDLKPFISRMMHGEKDVLWNGRVKWFSKSSGTTNDKSKFIPVTRDNLFSNHIKGSWDTLTLMYHDRPELEIFMAKSLIMGGTISRFEPYPDTQFGDISAIMIHHMPGLGRPFYTPDFETALMANWEQKIDRTAHQILKEKIFMFGGVPTWNLVLFKKILEITGASNLLEIWPELRAYIHGGVGFDPYRNQFKALLPADDFIYMEVYNASEGYFSVSAKPGDRDMLLLIDNGVFYEFIPMTDYINGRMNACTLDQVTTGVNYAMVVSTNAGLWRYMIGDTVKFTSTNPHKIQITGRTKQFVNAFGEEVMVANTDQALARACQTHETVVSDYTVAPIYFGIDGKGGHQWIIEFEKPPKSIQQFGEDLDRFLQDLNSDYEAKRTGGLALKPLKINMVPRGTFLGWLRSKGKVGGQNKVPRLSNNRKIVEEILDFIQQTG